MISKDLAKRLDLQYERPNGVDMNMSASSMCCLPFYMMKRAGRSLNDAAEMWKA